MKDRVRTIVWTAVHVGLFGGLAVLMVLRDMGII